MALYRGTCGRRTLASISLGNGSRLLGYVVCAEERSFLPYINVRYICTEVCMRCQLDLVDFVNLVFQA